jgi:hypothetical protein
VVWASYENALVNAQAYEALSHWAELETLLNDATHAEQYRQAASRLKQRFNQSTSEGGFWDERNQCYAYWREKDGSVHGTNLVVPVNFSAIGYGLCDEPRRRTTILKHIESLMEQQSLFFWPLCFSSFPQEDGHPEVNWPFPKYENGDLFLAWGELGTRAYAAYDPSLALKYVQNVLNQYAKDGLAFQRYLRTSQAGAGNDILANNGNIVAGLYRNIYGLQPRHDRFYLEPHLVPELNGTRLKYQLRGQNYVFDLSVNDYAVAVDNFTVRTRAPCAINVKNDILTFFKGAREPGVLIISVADASALVLDVRSWPETAAGPREWTESCRRGTTARHTVCGLAPNTQYRLSRKGVPALTLASDASGRLMFECEFSDTGPVEFLLETESTSQKTPSREISN